MKDKRSFFERLTGSVSLDDEYTDELEEETVEEETSLKTSKKAKHIGVTASAAGSGLASWIEEEAGEGQLSVDVYETDKEIIIKTMVAGVKREDMDISLTRDMVTIRGKREEEQNISDEDYIHQELYWGSFSRSILLPHEVEIEEAEASESQGLLVIKLPKIDKDRQTKLKVTKSL